MKKHLMLLVSCLILVGSFAQTINKVIPYKDKKRDFFYYKGSFPVNKQEVLSIFTFKDVITLKLYNNQLEEIGSRNIERQSKGNYSTSYYLSNKHLFIEEGLKKKDLFSIVTLNKGLSTKELNTEKLPDHVNMLGTDYYYGVSKEDIFFKKVAIRTREIVEFKTEKAASKSISDFISFADNELIAIKSHEYINKQHVYSVSLYNNSGKEISSFPRLENNTLKTSIGFASNKDEIYVLGNYKINPNKKSLERINSDQKKPDHDGIFIKTMNSRKNIDKYLKYSEFKHLNEQMVKDKKTNLLPKFRFHLEDISFSENNTIVFGTIYRQLYRYDTSRDASSSLLSTLAEGETEYMGDELNYIIIFGINDVGEILWDRVISLDWKNHPQPEISNSFVGYHSPNFLNIQRKDNAIQCHYSFKGNINYFEIVDNQITNKKGTPYQLKPTKKRELAEDQYNKSFYWYNNFYFNEDGIGKVLLLDKTVFEK